LDIKSSIKTSPVYIENSNGILKCFTDPLVNSSLIQYEWLKNDSVLNEKNNDIYFNKINSTQVEGNYTCRIIFNNGQVLSSQKVLTVYSSNIFLLQFIKIHFKKKNFFK
jgi:hypothetical protein